MPFALKFEAELKASQEDLKNSPAAKAYFSALEKLLPSQRSDFYGLFEAMDGYPVIIRLIDPPLHEFLPSQEETPGGSDRDALQG